MKRPTLVAVVMGSSSDLPRLEGALRTLDEFGVAYEARVLSAHRSPAAVARFAEAAERRGLQVIIAAAGGAAHLAGVIASHTVLPVIGVPIPIMPLNGLDSLLATVQMPAGVPVATVAVGESGAVNAALLALQILGRRDRSLVRRLRHYKDALARKVASHDAELQKQLTGRSTNASPQASRIQANRVR